jgi:hypothetical protein
MKSGHIEAAFACSIESDEDFIEPQRNILNVDRDSNENPMRTAHTARAIGLDTP